ncbi:uncharacterized protein TRUGW13939_10297 [Talaromyces rugulosus]|uniref:Zn(2)-C6 fungal-type domain-containing protein n=1 Tax=Talaromyces rugulosus TaxID=121627 RepID=A0A7H8R9N2_TALRU|nr:uncharacterized protein TRUGW13939_10297 [Talaromyces rugulosus]QKX63129.1 hypothetical protein TRUGW13939_10297 [Talaromyces rugulosus]
MKPGQVALAPTACRRCRERKVRCSHEQPECAKCVRLGLECSYPEPPDRRLIAARRKRSTRSTPHEPRDTTTTPDLLARQSSEYIIQHEPPPRTSQTTGHPPELHISDAAKKLLQDTYFACAFNSSLTIHLPTFEQAIEQGTVPKHTLLAMYALAANFLVSSSSRGRKHYAVMRGLDNLGAVSETWALKAGKMALQEADQPTLYMIQTCQILSLYWFSKGDPRRNTMFSGIGYRAVRSIVIESKEMLCPGIFQPNGIEAEKMRRLFWASWITNVINSDHYTPGSAADTLVLTLPLPVSENAFLWSTEEPLATISQSSSKSQPTRNREPSIMAEIMKILMIWARIRDHIDMRRSFPHYEAWVNAFSLQKEISNWASQLPADLSYSKRNLYHQLVVKEQPIYVFLHALYHQCCLVLNSSLVPHFSGLSFTGDMPLEVVQISAAVALRSAQALSDLSAHLVALEWDPTQIAPFVGYCMYVAASVQMSVLPRNSESGDTRWTRLTHCLKLLELMKPYWAVLDRLWARISRLYDSQYSQLANTRTAAVPATPVAEELAQNEYLATPKRGTGSLDEPLENSVLHYSLRKLQRNPASSSSTQGLERAFSPSATVRSVADHMMQREDGASSYRQQQQQFERRGTDTMAPTISPTLFPMQLTNPHSSIHTPFAENQLQKDSFESNTPFPGFLTSLLPLHTNSVDENDWFQLDMQNSAQARQALNEFF